MVEVSRGDERGRIAANQIKQEDTIWPSEFEILSVLTIIVSELKLLCIYLAVLVLSSLILLTMKRESECSPLDLNLTVYPPPSSCSS